MKIKHNKKRNTAFLYETLIRELSTCMVKRRGKKKYIISILKEHFNKGTLLYKELKQYKELYEANNLDKDTAQRIISYVVQENGKLNKQKLFVEQSKLISRINRELSKEVFNNFVPNYKNIATIYQLFNSLEKPKERVLLENKIVEQITSVEKDKLEPIGNLAYKSFVNNFNNIYSKNLIKEQKELLKNYVNSFSDNGLQLKIYLNEEIGRLKDVVVKSLEMDEIKEDEEIKNKTNNVLKIIDEFKNKPIDKEIISQVMNIQQLVEEIKS